MKHIFKVAVHLKGGSYNEYNVEAKNDLLARTKAIRLWQEETTEELKVEYAEVEHLLAFD